MELLTAYEQKQLLQIARKAVISCTRKEEITLPSIETPRLNEKRGCFVCIKIKGELRGCIGNFFTEKPLYALVHEMAEAASCHDPRFYPMKSQDLDDFNLEISVLTPMRQVSSVEEIEVGKHGIFLEKNSFRGVLLPQVATEHGWTRETFLEQTCLKAGLKKTDWQDGAAIYIFSAQVFSDKNIPPKA